MTATTAAASILGTVRELPASRAAVVLALTPVFGVALPGETVSPVQVGGAAPILGELQAVGRGRTPAGRQRPPPGPRPPEA